MRYHFTYVPPQPNSPFENIEEKEGIIKRLIFFVILFEIYK
jgi:hypothetical protein